MTSNEQAQLDIISQAALSNGPTLYFSFEASEQCITEGIGGDFVECGVYAGAQCAAMALACQKHKDNRKIHLFDSFEGIPKAGPYDPECLSGQSISPLQNTMNFMGKWDIEPERLIYHKGWFEDTVPKADIPRIAILRLDGDFEQSYRDSLPLCAKLVTGGFCIIDDWNLSGCRRAVLQYFGMDTPRFMQTMKVKRISGPDGPIWFRKKKGISHEHRV